SSPKNNCILSQGSCPRSGSLTSSAYKAFGVEPPARQMLKEPLAFAAAFADLMNSSAARLAILAASCRIRASAFARSSVMRRPPLQGFPFLDPNARLSRNDSGSVRQGGAAALVDFLFARPAPWATILLEQFFGFDGPPRTGRIIGESTGGQSMPHV